MRQEIHESIRKYFEGNKPLPLVPGMDYLPVSGKVIDSDELSHVVDAALDMWFTSGRFTKQFEKDFADFMEQDYCLLVNSGSSANKNRPN